ncbi:MAG: CubicO group peptidase (beta-lactamase class C family) [Glaciecola sp.]|jgi:CubicO group peptidase (beta-lactamase class C family)
MNKILIILLLPVLFSCNQTRKSSPEISHSENLINDFANLVENDLKDDNIKGAVAFVILKEDNIVSSKTFGFITPDNEKLADSSTIFRVGSITKSLTGFLLLKLQQDGVLKLDDPVEKYLPEIKKLINYDQYPPITFRQLASHTSGIDRESRYREANFGSVKEWEEKVLSSIPETSFRFTPNERFGYSNIGYAILGFAISRAADKPFTELIKEKILQPLAMTNTFFVVPENKKNNLAKGMAGGPTAELDYELPLKEHEGRGYRIPNGGLYSTANDMAKFMKACMGYSTILNEVSLQLLQNSQTPTVRLRSNYSFGFILYSGQGINTAGHGGSTPGYSAHFEFEKNTKYGIIIMRNYNFGNTNFDLRSNAFLRKINQLK